MAKFKKKPQKTTMSYKGITYTGTFDNGTLKVRSQRSACGNEMVKGVFDPIANTWHNDHSLPIAVRKYFESVFTV